MKPPIFNVMSLVVPLLAGSTGYALMRIAKGATTVGEALAPLVALMVVLTGAAVVGELAAVIPVVRAERLGWLSWPGVAVNVVLLLPAIYFLWTADWS